MQIFEIFSTQTLRVSLQQATTILVSFISEQLELDLKRNVKVNEGELTQLEADLEAEEWEKVSASINANYSVVICVEISFVVVHSAYRNDGWYYHR